MIILGVDPGTLQTGYGIVRKTGNKYEMISYGTIKTSPKDNLSSRLKLIFEEIRNCINYYKPDIFAIESIFYSKNVKSSLVIGHTRGVLLLSAELSDLPIYEFSPREVKLNVTGYGNANKEQVQFMVTKILNLKEAPKPFDSSDALAVAICCGQNLLLKSI